MLVYFPRAVHYSSIYICRPRWRFLRRRMPYVRSEHFSFVVITTNEVQQYVVQAQDLPSVCCCYCCCCCRRYCVGIWYHHIIYTNGVFLIAGSMFEAKRHRCFMNYLARICASYTLYRYRGDYFCYRRQGGWQHRRWETGHPHAGECAHVRVRVG